MNLLLRRSSQLLCHTKTTFLSFISSKFVVYPSIHSVTQIAFTLIESTVFFYLFSFGMYQD